MNRNAGILCTLLLALAGTGTAQAQFFDRGWTFEIAYGKTTFKDVDQAGLDAATRSFFADFALPVQTLTSTLDDKDKSWAVSAGYRFNRWLGAEASYYSLGKVRYASVGTVSDAGTILPSAFDFSFGVKGIQIGGFALLPIGRNFELRARAGISNSDVSVRFAATVDGDTLRDGFSDSAQDFYYGAGAGLIIADYYRIGLDYTKFDKVGKNSTGTTDVDNVMLSVGFRY
jgi:hypothetical protein